MRLWKADWHNVEVRQVEGTPWPGKDSEGEQCFDNTHFLYRHEAVESLLRNALAKVELTADSVQYRRQQFAQCEHRLAQARLDLLRAQELALLDEMTAVNVPAEVARLRAALEPGAVPRTPNPQPRTPAVLTPLSAPSTAASPLPPPPSPSAPA